MLKLENQYTGIYILMLSEQRWHHRYYCSPPKKFYISFHSEINLRLSLLKRNLISVAADSSLKLSLLAGVIPNPWINLPNKHLRLCKLKMLFNKKLIYKPNVANSVFRLAGYVIKVLRKERVLLLLNSMGRLKDLKYASIVHVLKFPYSVNKPKTHDIYLGKKKTESKPKFYFIKILTELNYFPRIIFLEIHKKRSACNEPQVAAVKM